MRSSELFDRIGGDALRAVIADFYDRVFDDVMIGFMFEGKNKRHLIDREWELVAALLGAPGVTYTGRPMRTAHARHTIFGGHFERRFELLRQTLRDHAVDPEVQRAWLDHTEALRSQITRDAGSECKDTRSAEPKLAIAPDPDRPVKLGRR
jgi:hemoglobin